MTRLDRVLNLLEQYDSFARVAIMHTTEHSPARKCLDNLRAEKNKLTQELIEHGCRRKN